MKTRRQGISLFIHSAWIIVLLLISGCMTVPPEPEWYPQSVAILPFSNETADFDIHEFARYSIHSALTNQGYENIMPLEEVDRRLEEIGITEGGQLPTISDEELEKVLGTECVLYGFALTAKRINVGVYLKRQFSAEYVMKKTLTGEEVWRADHLSKSSKINLSISEALTDAATVVASDLLSRGFKNHPLNEHITNVTYTCLKTYPNWEVKKYEQNKKK